MVFATGTRKDEKVGRINERIIRVVSGLSDRYREIGSARMQFRNANLNWKIMQMRVEHGGRGVERN